MHRVGQKKKSSSITIDVSASQGVADAIDGPAALMSPFNEGNANVEASVQVQSLDIEGSVPKKMKTVEGSSTDLPMILSGESPPPIEEDDAVGQAEPLDPCLVDSMRDLGRMSSARNPETAHPDGADTPDQENRDDLSKIDSSMLVEEVIRENIVNEGPDSVSSSCLIVPMGKDVPAEDGVGGLEESSGKIMEVHDVAEMEPVATALLAGPVLDASTPEKSLAKSHESEVSNKRIANVKDFMRAERSAMWQEEEAKMKLRNPLTSKLRKDTLKIISEVLCNKSAEVCAI
jgi:hypothetical protein